jgi:hypothetical protein
MRIVSGRLAIITVLPDAELTEAERAIAQDVRDTVELSIYADQLMGHIEWKRRESIAQDVKFYLDQDVTPPGIRFDEVDAMEASETLRRHHDEQKRLPCILTVGRRAGKSAMLEAIAKHHLKQGLKHYVGTPRSNRSLFKPFESQYRTNPIAEAAIQQHAEAPLGHPLQNTFTNREVSKRWNEFLHEIGFHAPSGNDLTGFKPELLGPDGLPARSGLLAFDVSELLSYDMPISKVIESNSIKDIKDIEDEEFEFHMERATRQLHDAPKEVTSFEEMTNVFGPIKGFDKVGLEQFYKPSLGIPFQVGVDWAQEATDREIFADMEAAMKVPKEYLGTPKSNFPAARVAQAMREAASPTGVVTRDVHGPSRKLHTKFSAAEGEWSEPRHTLRRSH